MVRWGSAAAILLSTLLATPALAADYFGTNTYGNTFAAGSLWNTSLIGGRLYDNPIMFPKSGSLVSVKKWWVGTGGYGSGTGGTVKYELRTDDGTANHLPTNTILGQSTPVSGSVAQSGNGVDMHTVNFNSPIQVQANTWYHLIVYNTDPNPNANYIGMDDFGLCTKGDTIYQAPFTDSCDAVKNKAILEPQFDVLYKDGTGSWYRRSQFNDIVDFGFSDGSHFGDGYMEVSSTAAGGGQGHTVSGSQKVGEVFTVSGATKTASSLTVAVVRESGTSHLTATLTQNSTTIYTATDNGLAPLSSETYDGYKQTYTSFTFPVTLTAGATYRLEFSAPSDTTYTIHGVRDGAASGYGWDPATVFNDGYAVYNTGSGWTNGWDTWGSMAQDQDLSFFFTLGSASFTESPQSTTVTTAGPTITDSVGEVFSLMTGSSGYSIAVNGVIDTRTSQVTTLLYYNHTVYHQAAGQWWSESTNAGPWVATTDPRPSDTTAPSTPTNLTTTPTSQSQITLSWTASTDNTAVTGYKIYRNGTQVALSSGTSYSDIGLTAGTSYSYTVAAYDAAGNTSAQSGAVSGTTLNSSGGTTATDYFGSTVYGNIIVANDLANTQLSAGVQYDNPIMFPRSGTITAVKKYWIASPGYGGGTGGTVKYELHADDGSAAHLPSATILGQSSPVSGATAVSSGYQFMNVTFSAPIAVQAGVWYHLVAYNTDSNANTNNVSMDDFWDHCGNANLTSFPPYANSCNEPRNPLIPDPQFGVLYKNGSGSWIYRGGFTNIIDFTYGDGSHWGDGYMEEGSTAGGSFKGHTVSGTQQVGETFTVSGVDRTVSGLTVTVERVSGSSPLTAKLISGGQTIAVATNNGTIPQGSDSFAAGNQRFATFNLSATLKAGTTYQLQFSAPSDTTYIMHTVRDGASSGYGWNPQTVFSDGYANYNTGSGWTTGWDTWGSLAQDQDLQFFFTLGGQGGGSGGGSSTNPVGWWKFDQTSGTTASDSSGSNYTGTLVGSPTWVTGKMGNAISFNGTNSYVDFSNILSLVGSDLSLSVWVKPTAVTDYMSFIDKLANNGNYRLLGYANGVVEYGIRDAANGYDYIDSAAGVLQAGQWTHIAVVHTSSNNTATLYINGVAAGTKTFSLTRNDAGVPLRAGYTTNNGVYYNGAIDDMRIYNRALSASEVQGVYNSASFTESPQGTTVTTAGPTITDSVGEVFSLMTGSSGYSIAVNGVIDTRTSQVTTLLYYNHTVYHQAAGQWWSESTNAGPWVATTDPRGATPTPTPTPTPAPTGSGPDYFGSNTYGNSIKAGSLWNTALVGGRLYDNPIMFPRSGTIVSVKKYWTGGAGGYGGGTYGTVKYELRADDGSATHLPSSTILAQSNALSASPAQTGVYFATVNFTTPVQVQAGVWYHLIAYNTDPSPDVNFVSMNDLGNCMKGDTLDQAPFTDSCDAVKNPAILEPQFNVNYKDGSGSWYRRTDFNNIIEFGYSDGSHFGDGYMEVSSTAAGGGQGHTVSGTQKVAEVFTVSGATKGVSTLTVAAVRLSGSSHLTATLTQNGTTIYTATDNALIPLSSETSESYKQNWTTFTFPVTLTGHPTPLPSPPPLPPPPPPNPRSTSPGPLHRQHRSHRLQDLPQWHPGSTSNTTSYSDTTLTAATTYTYTVAAYDAAGNTSAQSTASSATTLTAPANFVAGDRVQVVNGPLNVRSTPSTSGTILGSQVTGAYGMVIGGPTVANGYTWWNINYDTGVDGWSVQDYLVKVSPLPTATLSANPTSVPTGSASTLTWSSTNATSCTASNGWTGAKATSGTQQVTPTIATTYTLTCTGSGGTSAPVSTTVTVTDTQAPTVPTNLTATAASQSQINLTWTASTDNTAVSGYKVYRDGTQVATIAATSYSDTNLTPSTVYSYTVAAYDAAGNTLRSHAR
jgi:hypothetical protein